MHDRKGDEELERTIGAIRAQLARAKQRVAAHYPRGRIRWVLETREWVVIDLATCERIESSRSLDELATRPPSSAKVPESGTYYRPEKE